METSKDINEPIKLKRSIEEEEMTDTQTVPLNSLLLYIVDGIIPLMTTFCKQLKADSSELMTPTGMVVLKSIGDSIGVSICRIILSGDSQYVHMHTLSVLTKAVIY